MTDSNDDGKTRLAGKLLRNTKTGKEFACRECFNTDFDDDTLVLESIDIEYYYPRAYVLGLVGDDGNLEIVRDLHNKHYPFIRRRVVEKSVWTDY